MDHSSTAETKALDGALRDGDALGSRAPRWLMPASLAYLAIPTLIFVVGWTRPLIAFVAAAALLLLVAMSIRSALAQQKQPMPTLIKLGIWGGATVSGLIAGAGAVLPQTSDWLKHNAILRDLVVEQWPVVYDIDGQSFQLTYYLGYYLPAAVVGKVAGWQAANIALLVWTIIGIGLAFTWFAALTKAAGRGWILLLAILFSGPDLLGHLILSPLLRYPDPALQSGQLDWWAQIGQFPNPVTGLMWGPHHTIAAWVAAGLILYLTTSRQMRWILPVVAFCGLVSPLTTVGLLPLVGWAVVRDGRDVVSARLRELFMLPTALAAVAVAPVLAYYSALAAPLPAPYDGSVIVGFAITNPVHDMNVAQAAGAYVLLIILEVLIFVFLLGRSPIGKESDARSLLLVVTATLVLLPLLRYGQWSDLAMRAVMPSLFVLSMLLGRMLLELPRSNRLRLVLLYLLVIGLKAPQLELGRTYSDSHFNGEFIAQTFDADSADETFGIARLGTDLYGAEPRFVAQYTGSTDTFFSDFVARTPGDR